MKILDLKGNPIPAFCEFKYGDYTIRSSSNGSGDGVCDSVKVLLDGESVIRLNTVIEAINFANSSFDPVLAELCNLSSDLIDNLGFKGMDIDKKSEGIISDECRVALLKVMHGCGSEDQICKDFVKNCISKGVVVCEAMQLKMEHSMGDQIGDFELFQVESQI